ncbi:MAG: tripartite tricarboxylate transporter substrate binding protein [Betaproteobacteria bacterium]
MKTILQRGVYSQLVAVLGGSLLMLCAATVQAQQRPWPDKPVRVVVPAPAGSAPDTIVRVIGQKLSDVWGQPVVIENVVGASGNIGTDRVAKALPDGYTLLFNTIGPIAVNVTLFGDKLPYDPVKDLAPVSLVIKMPNLLTVNPKLPVRNLAELIAMAKKEPGKLRYGTAGAGTTQHLSGELLNTLADINLVGIPYKSSAQMTTEAIGGQIEVLFHNAPVLLPHIKAGTLRPIAITSTKRSASAPDVPTMSEAGVSGFEVTAWFGFMAPAATSPALIRKISADVVRIVATPEIQERILSQASEPVGSSPEEYAAFIKSEIAKWRDVIRQANIKAD